MNIVKYKKPLVILLGVLFIGLFLTVTQKTKSSYQSQLSCLPKDYSGVLDYSDNVAFYNGAEVEVPLMAYENIEYDVLGVSTEERWIDVDLSEQKLRAWEGNSLFLEAPVSTGLSWWPTPTGEFRIWIKLRYAKMEGGSGKYYYYLPNVPYVMYFENSEIPGYRGYGIHGAYWHNDFGTPRSHGCVNLAPNVAGQLYHWVSPTLSEGKSSIRATAQNPGTRIVIHE